MNFKGFLQLKEPKEVDGVGVIRTKILDLWSFQEDGEILTLHIQDKKSAKVIRIAAVGFSFFSVSLYSSFVILLFIISPL
jgi:hypothetical protein